jgi:hypothetical protein
LPLPNMGNDGSRPGGRKIPSGGGVVERGGMGYMSDGD